jgi:hypothetical protein
MDRQELGVRIGEMQHADVAEAANVVEIVIGGFADLRKDSGRCRSGEEL